MADKTMTGVHQLEQNRQVSSGPKEPTPSSNQPRRYSQFGWACDALRYCSCMYLRVSAILFLRAASCTE